MFVYYKYTHYIMIMAQFKMYKCIRDIQNRFLKKWDKRTLSTFFRNTRILDSNIRDKPRMILDLYVIIVL